MRSARRARRVPTVASIARYLLGKEPQPPGALRVRGWSATVGANQSRIVDLLVSSVGNVVAVTGTVLLFVAEPLALRLTGGLLLAALWSSSAGCCVEMPLASARC